jgi:hypothetical protein
MTEKEKRPTVLLVAGGLVMSSKKKIARRWYRIPDDTDLKGWDLRAWKAPPTNDLRIYSGRKMNNQTAGTVRRLEHDVDAPDSVYVPGEFVGIWPDNEWRAQVAIEDRAFREERAAVKREKDEKGRDPLAEVMAPLRRIYNGLRAPARAQMIARVIHELQKGARR